MKTSESFRLLLDCLINSPELSSADAEALRASESDRLMVPADDSLGVLPNSNFR